VINEAWCKFISVHNVSVRTEHRWPVLISMMRIAKLDRGGEVRIKRPWRDCGCCRSHGIPFHVISGNHPAVARTGGGHLPLFFTTIGISQLGFNIEEDRRGGNGEDRTLTSSGPMSGGVRKLYGVRSFGSRRQTGCRMTDSRIRCGHWEKIRSQKSLRSFDFPHFNEQVRPFGNLNVGLPTGTIRPILLSFWE